MKRIEYQLLMLFAALTFLGCSQDETTKSGGSESTESPVYFLAATNDAMTRGIAMPAGDLATTTTFRVYATQQHRQGDTPTGDITAFINPGASSTDNVVSHHNVNIYADNPNINPYYVGVWKTNKDYFWPQDTRLVNFYAVHPAEAPGIADITTSKSIVYDATTPLPGNYDLMYDMVENTHREGYGDFVKVLPDLGDNSAVVLTFHHLLSRIMFYGKLSAQFVNWGWKVDVGSITLHNVNGAGTFDFDNLNDEVTTNDGIVQASPAVLTNYTFTMNDDRQVVTTTTVAQDVNGQNIPLTSPTEITAVIPQNPTKWAPATETIAATTGCYLEIQMSIKDGSDHYHLGSANSYGTVYVPFETGIQNITGAQISWQASKTYNYTLEFGAGYDAAGKLVIQPITISTAIQPWTSTTVGGEATHKKTNE